jgi:hypothetical protein
VLVIVLRIVDIYLQFKLPPYAYVRTFCTAKATRQALGLSQLPIQWVEHTISPVGKEAGA